MLTPVALLFMIFVLFSLKGQKIVQLLLDVLRVAIRFGLYLADMFFITFFVAHRMGASYEKTATAAFATVIGPLAEVPLLMGLVNLALVCRKRLFIPDKIERKEAPPRGGAEQAEGSAPRTPSGAEVNGSKADDRPALHRFSNAYLANLP